MGTRFVAQRRPYCHLRDLITKWSDDGGLEVERALLCSAHGEKLESVAPEDAALVVRTEFLQPGNILGRVR